MRIEAGDTRARHRRLGRDRPRAREALARRGARSGWSPATASELDAARRRAARRADRARRRRRPTRRRSSARSTSFAEKAGGLDLLVANAGIAHYGPFADVELEHAEQMVAINVLGTIYTVEAGLHHMLDQGRGHVVVVSSGAGLRAFPWGAVYGGDQGVRPRLRRGAAPRALGHRRLGHHRLPGRGGDRASRPPAATRCPTGGAATTTIPAADGRAAAIVAASRPTAARSTSRAPSGCSASTASRRALTACSPRCAAAAPRRGAISRGDFSDPAWF